MNIIEKLWKEINESDWTEWARKNGLTEPKEERRKEGKESENVRQISK